jgi:biofilm PGA synthesis N-glycosyltransferase PgaC
MAARQELSYAVITPVRNDADNLRRLAQCLATQEPLPETWLVVLNGSDDETSTVVRELEMEHAWIRRFDAQVEAGRTRAEAIVQAFEGGLSSFTKPADVVVKVDADVSFRPTFFKRLVGEFAADQRLGIASGSCYEQELDGTWRQRHGTGSGVWGCCRAYRRESLPIILPLEKRMGWDTIDLIKAQVRGWTARAFLDLPFKHHRPEGSRERTALRQWAGQGEAARYMGYRFSYLVLRTLYRSRRQPAAIAMIGGYLRAAIRRDPVIRDCEIRRFVRRQQSIWHLPSRIREARRKRHRLAADKLA